MTVDSSHINRAVADGREFGASGIRLIPGTYRFELSASHGEPPYGCRPYTIVDTYGFDRCQKERAADIRKGKKDPQKCLLSTYTKHRTTCLRDYRDSACEMQHSSPARKDYASARHYAHLLLSPRLCQAIFSIESVRTSGMCRFLRLRTEQKTTRQHGSCLLISPGRCVV